MDTEDMSIWFDGSRNRFYGIFHAHDHLGLITSEDGIHWKSSDEPVVSNKEIKMWDGSVILPDRMERPFVHLDGCDPKVLSIAIKKGDDAYSVFMPIETPKYPKPNHRQVAWQEAELGFVFHYDLHVFDNQKYNQQQNRIKPVDDYQIFNPPELDTDQWVKAVKDAGGTFAIITATHETGFALYQSDVNPYSLKALRWKNGKGDIVRDFVNSCRKFGIKPGIYVGLRWNSLLGVHNFEVQGSDEFKENRQKWYKQMVEGMVKELCTNYGDLFEIWFDGGADHPDNGAADVLPIVRRYQPNCLFYHNGQLAEARWGGSESGTVSYPCWATFPYKATGTGETAQKEIYANNYKMLKEGDQNGTYWMPAMSDAPLRGYNGRHEWFWEPGDEAHIYPLDDLMNMYYKSIGRNSTLIIGLTPDDRGLLPEPDVARLKQWGAEINRRFEKPIATTQGQGDIVTINLNQPTLINHAIIQEDIRYGERVRSYVLEGKVDGQWIQIAKGMSIGHKRIEKFEQESVTEIKLRVIRSSQEPIIRQFSIFHIEEND